MSALCAAVHDLHLLPVVRQLLAAIEADYVCTGREGGAAALAFLNRDRKTVALVPATEKCVDNLSEHLSTSTETRSGLGAGSSVHLLRFSFLGKGSKVAPKLGQLLATLVSAMS
jgi:hypothetical protein